MVKNKIQYAGYHLLAAVGYMYMSLVNTCI